MPVSIFFAYAHRDEELKNELLKHLSPLKRLGKIEAWHDRLIEPGAAWDEEIDSRLGESHIIVLLISADFIHSEYCFTVEMKRALARHEAKEAIVVPVIARRCDWHQLPIQALQVLPKDGQPISSWPSIDDALTDVAQGIRKIVDAFSKRSPKPVATDDSIEADQSTSSSELKPMLPVDAVKHNGELQLSSPRARFLFARSLALDFAKKLAICILLQIFFLFPGIRTVSKRLDDPLSDWMLQVVPLPLLSTSEKHNAAYTLIDIDDATYELWKRPRPLPRDKLLKLLLYATAGNARLIVFDVRLDLPTSQGDELFRFLSQYKNDSTPIVLVRSLKENVPKGQLGACPELSTQFPDSRNLVLATQIVADRATFVPLWESVCESNAARVLPSVPLFANAWLKENTNGTARLKQWLRGRDVADCSGCGTSFEGSVIAEDLNLAGLHLNSVNNFFARVRFLIPWKSDKQVVANGHLSPFLYDLPARQITDNVTNQAQLSLDLIKDRVVFIGGSFSPSGDIRNTPAGDMPGAVLLINAVESLRRFGPLSPPTPSEFCCLIAAWNVSVGLSFAALCALAARFHHRLILTVVLFGASCILAISGAWTIFAAPLLVLWLVKPVRIGQKQFSKVRT